ncbi:65-kDa microtubule-associated protein 5 [Euphorbia lathyris]|uniref:65-kDa microtubule-associated protein 5 n=1 Tax=Euphorbia lathyris TaxID=212925 RepID=UPI0033138E24
MADIFSPVSSSRTTCGSLLRDLQKIWDEIGEGDSERDKMLLQLEQECLDIYRRKVELTRKYKADLLQSVSDAESEITNLVSALGENVSCSRGNGTLKKQISAVKPVLEDLRLKKQERMKDFHETQMQIARIRAEIAGICSSDKFTDPQVNENDLTMKRLGELKSHLKELQSEKSLRLQKVNSNIAMIHDLSVVMAMDFFEIINDVHPSLSASTNAQSKSISNDTFARLAGVINSLKQEKHQRLQKLQGLGRTLSDLWELMDIDPEERRRWDHITSLSSSRVDDVSKQGCLALEVIEQTELEVERLSVLKISKLKELIFKRQNELEEIYRGVHMDVDSEAARQILAGLIESGNVDLSDLLSSMDDQINKAKEEALSRKDILEKVERWKCASEEEKWLDEYEKDENRYNAGRGAHKNLKRAEKARVLVSKISSIVENLTVKVKAWESERGVPFLYEKEPLLETLDEYTLLRQEREEDKRRSREQKRLHEQYAAEQEAIYGSKPSAKKPLGQIGNTLAGTPAGRRVNTPGHHAVSGGKERRESRLHYVTPINYVALAKDDSASRGY